MCSYIFKVMLTSESSIPLKVLVIVIVTFSNPHKQGPLILQSALLLLSTLLRSVSNTEGSY